MGMWEQKVKIGTLLRLSPKNPINLTIHYLLHCFYIFLPIVLCALILALLICFTLLTQLDYSSRIQIPTLLVSVYPFIENQFAKCLVKTRFHMI